MRRSSWSGMRSGRGFTLTEVLVVLLLFGVSLSLLLFVFSRGVSSSLAVEERSERVSLLASLFWDMERKIFGAERIYIEGDALYMVTSGGSYYPGLVRCAYIFRDGDLLYFEDPDLSKEIYATEGDGIRIGRFERFRVVAVEGNRDLPAYDGLPRFVRVYLDDMVFTFETLR